MSTLKKCDALPPCLFSYAARMHFFHQCSKKHSYAPPRTVWHLWRHPMDSLDPNVLSSPVNRIVTKVTPLYGYLRMVKMLWRPFKRLGFTAASVANSAMVVHWKEQRETYRRLMKHDAVGRCHGIANSTHQRLNTVNGRPGNVF